MWQIVPAVGGRSRPSLLVRYNLFEGYPLWRLSPSSQTQGLFSVGADWTPTYTGLVLLLLFFVYIPHTYTHRQTHGHMLLCFVFASGPLAYWRVNGRLAASCVRRRFFLRYLWNYSSACDDDDVMPLAGCCYTASPWNIKLLMFNEFEPPLHQEQQLDT